MNHKIDKEEVRRRFSKHLPAYDSLAVVQQQIAGKLAGNFIGHSPATFMNVLEIGCGTGFLTREMLNVFPIEHIYLNDLVPEALPVLAERLRNEGREQELTLLPGDAERLKFPEQLDLVASASTVQWFNNQPRFFAKTANALKQGGWLIFNSFAPENFYQIKTLTGQGLKYPTTHILYKRLKKYFRILETHHESFDQEFDTPFDVLRHLQQTGVTATGEFSWTPGRLREFEREYLSRYSYNGKVLLHWDVVYIIAKK